MPVTSEPESAPVRTRTKTSAAVGVLMLLALACTAFLVVTVIGRLAGGHSLPNLGYFLFGGILMTLWLLIAAVAFLSKTAGAASLGLAGVLGIAVGFVGIFTHAGGAITRAGTSTGREDLFFWSVTFLPLLAGIGHIREARRRSPTLFYVAAPLVTLAGVAASFR